MPECGDSVGRRVGRPHAGSAQPTQKPDRAGDRREPRSENGQYRAALRKKGRTLFSAAAGNSIIASPRLGSTMPEYGDFPVVKDAGGGRWHSIRRRRDIGSRIGKDCRTGPAARLGPGSRAGDRGAPRPGRQRREDGKRRVRGPWNPCRRRPVPAQLARKTAKDGAVTGAGATQLSVRIRASGSELPDQSALGRGGHHNRPAPCRHLYVGGRRS